MLELSGDTLALTENGGGWRDLEDLQADSTLIFAVR